MKRYIVALFLLLMLTEVSAFGQSRSRFVRSPSCPYQDDAVLLEISGLHIADREVAFDEPFVGGDDWLAHLKLRIVNKGTKPIAGIKITIGLLEGVDEELPTYASFDYGMQLFRINQVKTKRGKSRLFTLIKPGEEIEITAEGSRPYGLRYMDALLEGTTRAKNWKEFVPKAGARFHRAEMMGPVIWFTDGTEGRAELLVRRKCDKK
jgi:hypothetical protein